MSDEEKRLALYSYPTSLSSPKITPTDLTFFKTEGVVKANDFFDSRYQDIIKQAEELKEQIELNERVYSCRYTFEPQIGKTYHVYLDKNGKEFLSLINPNEWKTEYVMSVRLNSDSVWKKISL